GFGANLRLVSGGAAIGSSLVGAGQVKGAVILDQSEGFGANLHLISGGGADAGQIDSQSGRFGAKLHLVSGGTGQVKDDSSGAHLINNLAYDNSAAFGAKSQQSFSQYHGQSGVVLTGQTLAQGAEVSGYDNTKASVKYHGNTGSSFASGTSGNINIIGGGYSAVGVANSGIEITNYGDNSNTISHVTPSPISVTTVSSIPTVTSVPVPALKVASGFQSYKGGVVANIPQLQYKVRKPVSNVFYQSNLATARGGSGFVNISSNFVNTISSTPSTITVAGGYHYPKPTVAFVEEPVKTTLYQQPLVTSSVVQQNIASVQPVVISTTQTPLVVEKVQPVVTNYQKPVSFVQQHVSSVQPIVTTYQKPYQIPLIVDKVNVQPVVVSTNQTPLVVENVNVQPAVSTYNVQKEDTSFVGYDYPKPAVAFEEIPVKAGGASFSYQNLNTAHRSQNHAAAASFSYSASSTVKPVTVVEQVQPVVTTYQKPAVSTTSFVQQHVQPIVTTYQKPVIVSTTQTPLVVEKVNIQPAVSTYNVQKEDTGFVGYNYPKPAVAFEETPVQTGGASFSYQNLNAAHRSQNQAALASFSYSAPSTVKPVTVVEQIQPVVQVQPTVQVTPQVYVSSTPAPIIEQKVVEPAVVSSFSISSNSGGYQYQKPSVATYEQPAVSTYYQTPVQPAISRYNYKNVVQSVLTQGYSSPKPAVAFKEAPAVVSSFSFTAPSTVKPAVVVQKQKSVVTAKPAVVTSYSYSAPSTVKPAVIFEQPVVSHIPSSTPRPQVLVQRQPAVVSSYSYSAGSTARPAAAIDFAGYNYPKTAVSFVEESSPVVSYENREPVKEELFVAKKAYVTGSQSTSYQQQFNNAAAVQVQQKPLVVENYQAPVVSTTPLYEYKQQYSSVDSGSFDNQYKVAVSAPLPSAKVVEDYVAPISVTTSAPLDAYVVPEVGNYGIKVTTSSPIEVTPSSEYLPARARVKVTTTAPTEEYLVPEVTTPRARVRVTTPSTVYLPVKTVRPSTIVKVNDFHPLLSAKLGAQCTCVSNSLKLAKKKLKIVVEDDDDDGYVVDNNENGNVVENYQYEPQKIVQITPTPEVYIKSTPNELIEPSPTPGYAVRKRVRVRPVTSTAYPVTNAAELFVKAVTPVTVVQPTLSAEANLVPIAGGASAALQGKNFDRYGPGGWRSRNERLQGTIDCQRAGLFRHPTQCNKFYACRWDCTKNRYTLHVFNCPVHLTFDNNLGACNWPSQGPACLENTLLPSD
ncbi:CBM 14 domain containing protein, partial [Asbolus verrucosus]